MFTGIVQHVGVVRAVRNTDGGARLAIDVGPLAGDLKRGDSVAVNGACLTAVDDCSDKTAEFDAIAETLKRTALGGFRPGRKVNLEPAMKLSDALDGHIVQGHIDAVATVRRIDRGQPCILELQCDKELAALMAPKGSVAITDTTLGDLSPGDTVNIEADIIGKYVATFLRRMIDQGSGPGAVTLDKLREAGFI